MKKSFLRWEIVGFIVCVITGVLLHFLYEWTNEAVWVAPFSAVNESTWEHMKLLFIPLLIFAFIQIFAFKEYDNFWGVKLKGIILGVCLIPLIYYMYNGVIGKSPDFVNIAIFVLSAAISFTYEYKILDAKNIPTKNTSIILLLFILGLFILFTFAPLEIAIFKDSSINLSIFINGLGGGNILI